MQCSITKREKAGFRANPQLFLAFGRYTARLTGQLVTHLPPVNLLFRVELGD
jgi:hypothetical protein